nr:hypothetical protein [Thermoanaerobaculia bacterium]
MAREWAFIGSEDNLLRCIDIGSGETRWLKGLDGLREQGEDRECVRAHVAGQRRRDDARNERR